MKKILLMTVLMGACFAAVWAQTPERVTIAPGEGMVGKVTAVSKDSLTVSRLAGGEPVTVKVGENTRILKDRQAVKLEEIKTDEIVFVRGKLTGNTVDAMVVGVVPGEMVQRLQQSGGAGGEMAGFNREDLGKKFILGEVKAIHETKLTIARPDGQTQEVEVDENTSFKKGTESITLPDIKVGDFVRGRGELKENVFVPKELIVGRQPMRIMMGGPGGQPPATKPSATEDTKEHKDKL